MTNHTLQDQPSHLKALRVIIADDNQDSCECLGIVLRLSGAQVWTAGDGFKAIAAAETHHPDVMLLDIGMPGMDGYEAARSIREKLGAASPILIALTGWSHDDDRARSKNAGFDHHLVKPVAPDALLKLLASLTIDRPNRLSASS
jgi:two-component system, chemotaxis family, CheB/CheR fusion protein